MKYYIIAGEASGDLHASRLIRSIRQIQPNAVFRAWGGDLMQAEGAEVVKHYRDLAFMGFVEVLSNLPTILGNMSFCKKDMLAFQPDVVIFVDYPGFNIPIARFAKKKGFNTAYYISPQVWAWKENRVKTLRRVIDKMLVILPFEQEFYKKWAYEVTYVGHPLIEIIDDFHTSNGKHSLRSTLLETEKKKLVALLPGSRKQEIAKKLPIMLAAAADFPEAVFAVAQAPGISDELIKQYTQPYTNVKLVKGNTYGLLASADAALVTSGTATLETALFRVPEVVCYKGSPVSYAIAKRVIKVPFISLVNLIMGREVVKELIQDALNKENIRRELNAILYDEAIKQKMQEEYSALQKLLSTGGRASVNAAEIITRLKPMEVNTETHGG